MKIKRFFAIAFPFFLLALFIPVLGCVILIGNDMNYNAEHKIDVYFSNMMFFIFAILAFIVISGVYYLLNKIPVNKYTVAGTVLFSLAACVLFYFVKVAISRSIAFFGGWDCGMVSNSACWFFEGKGLGYDNYYQIYSNNVPITWLLYVLYRFSVSLTDYAYDPEFIWVQFQCIMFAAAIFFSVMTVLVISRKIAPAILDLVICIVLLGLCPWQIVAYTDAASIAFPVFTVFLYALFRHAKSGFRYIFWLLLSFVGMLGGILKATCYIALIAVALTELIWFLSDREWVVEKMMGLVHRGIILCCGIFLALWCRNGIYRDLDYVPDYDMQMTWSNYFYMGLNEITTGASSADGYIIAQSYIDYPREFRRQIELYYAKDRIMNEKGGIPGTLNFWLRKQVMNFNDGTFSWFQEGAFHASEYKRLGDSPHKEDLRNFYWLEGDDYKTFCTYSQGVWIFVMLGVVLEGVAVMFLALRRKEGVEALYLRVVQILIFIGIFLFVMLFEGRARYLLNNVPVFVTMAAFGYSEAVREFGNCCKRITDRLKHTRPMEHVLLQ